MSSVALDTYKAIKRLTEAGAKEELAKAVVDTVAAAVGGNLATKDDLKVIKNDIKTLKGDVQTLKEDMKNLRNELKGDMENLRGELKGDMENLRGELKGNMENLRGELKEDMENLGKRLDDRLTASIKIATQRSTIILGGMLIAAVTLILAAMRMMLA